MVFLLLIMSSSLIETQLPLAIEFVVNVNIYYLSELFVKLNDGSCNIWKNILWFSESDDTLYLNKQHLYEHGAHFSKFQLATLHDTVQVQQLVTCCSSSTGDTLFKFNWWHIVQVQLVTHRSSSTGDTSFSLKWFSCKVLWILRARVWLIRLY